MRQIIKEIQKGKTSKIIELAAANNGQIVCFNNKAIPFVLERAREMKIKVKRPITFKQMLSPDSVLGTTFDYYIDDLDLCIQYQTFGRIKAISMTRK